MRKDKPTHCTHKYLYVYIYICVCVRHICTDVNFCYLLFFYIYIYNIYIYAGGHRGRWEVGDQRRHLPGTRVNVPAGLW